MGRSNFSDDYGTPEGAVDNGGPTRGFFQLCLHEIKDKIGTFEGPSNAKVLTCNSKGTLLINSYCCELKDFFWFLYVVPEMIQEEM